SEAGAVILGQVYAVKVSGSIQQVRLVAESPYGGWVGPNLQNWSRSAHLVSRPHWKQWKMHWSTFPNQSGLMMLAHSFGMKPLPLEASRLPVARGRNIR